MAEIRPFRGVLYNGNKLGGDLSDVMAPPYDVIPDPMREELYRKSEYGIIRLILGKECDGDNSHANKYIRAQEFLNTWIKDGIFRRDEEEALYVYKQNYKVDGKECERLGFLGLMKIEEPGSGSILPHEYTLSKPKEDRLNLIKHVKGNLSPIFTLYENKDGNITGTLESFIENTDPIIDIEIDGEKHKLWRFTDKEGIKNIVDAMKNERTFIADGHHRYEVARTYCEMQDGSGKDDGSADHVLIYFSDMTKPDNLTVLATHRVIKTMPTQDEEELTNKFGEYFEITECKDLGELKENLRKNENECHVFGFYSGNKYMLLIPKDDEKLRTLISEDRSDGWKSLDVSVLHYSVLDKILSVSKEEGNITYVKLPEEAEKLVKSGSHMAAFLLNPTRVEQLKAVAELGEMMPQKSTYFYPKLLTGLVINKFDEDQGK